VVLAGVGTASVLPLNLVRLVCTMNLHLLRGLIDGLGSRAQARLDPAEGRCCVAIGLPRASPAPRPGQ